MATIFGKLIYIGGYFYDNYNDTLIGTSADDTVYALGGNDAVWGNTGDDLVYGGLGNDTIRPGTPDSDTTTANWGNDVVYGGGGDDDIDFTHNLDPVYLYGEGGNDQIFGGSNSDYIGGGDGFDQLYGQRGNDLISGDDGNDWILGGSGNDNLFGGDDPDQLYGDSGNDSIYGEGTGNDDLHGGSGNDLLNGGAGGDFLAGDSGNDTFKFFDSYESSANSPDQIMDFNAQEDVIDMPVAGTAANYIEFSIGNGSGYNTARTVAEFFLNGGGDVFAFVTDQVDGYLFADLDGNGTIDTGVILEGLTSLSDFNHLDIV